MSFEDGAAAGYRLFQCAYHVRFPYFEKDTGVPEFLQYIFRVNFGENEPGVVRVALFLHLFYSANSGGINNRHISHTYNQHLWRFFDDADGILKLVCSAKKTAARLFHIQSLWRE